MAHHGPGKRITFPELERLLLDLGLSVAEASRVTGVARNTLAAIIAGNTVKPLTVRKILDGLSRPGYDVALPLRTLAERTQGAVANGNGGKPHLATVDGYLSDSKLVKDARDLSRKLLGLLELIAEHSSWARPDVERGDLDFLWANLTKLETEVQLLNQLRFPPVTTR